MDALSEALRAVRATGAIFFQVECGSPWGFAVPDVRQAAHLLAPGADRLINYHLVTQGRALVRISGGGEFTVEAGDVVIVPGGEAHTVSNGSPNEFADSAAAIGEGFSGRPKTIRLGGNGATARIVCGFIACDRSAELLFLNGLPRCIRISVGTAAGDWLPGALSHLVAEAENAKPGAAVLLSRMAEAVFVEAMRRYMNGLPPHDHGWLAGARDPLVGAALVRLHHTPENDWTLNALARDIGTSRTVLSKRFAALVGLTPAAYLRRWRLQQAAARLDRSRDPILQIAADIGYKSEAAFNRAFKAEFGMPPAMYRRHTRAGLSGVSK